MGEIVGEMGGGLGRVIGRAIGRATGRATAAEVGGAFTDYGMTAENEHNMQRHGALANRIATRTTSTSTTTRRRFGDVVDLTPSGSGHGQGDQVPQGKCKYMKRVGVSGRSGYRSKDLGELFRSITF